MAGLKDELKHNFKGFFETQFVTVCLSKLDSNTNFSAERGASNPGSICRHWSETGHCPYGSKCKKASTHSLVSPSKRTDSAGLPVDTRTGPGSKDRPLPVKKKGENGSPTIDPDWMNWDEENLDFDDELMLEKKRQLLERELAKQVFKIYIFPCC